ncbi:MAG: hypothetical protein HZA90_14745 [Verrucomicrobia bacterium]|nr:hypothetical protein [Verrucomicrobiota bacterium]
MKTTLPPGQRRRRSSALLLAAGLAAANWLSAATLTDFGYQAIRVDGDLNVGSRSLLVLLGNFSGRPAFYTNAAYYQSLVFSASAPSLYGFFRESSNGRFFWSMARFEPMTINQPWEWCVHGVLTNLFNHGAPGTPQTAWLADRLVGSNLVAQAMRHGFDFRPFDLNHDGVVRRNELTILIISNENEEWGATRYMGPVPPPDDNNITVDMGAFSHVNHRTDFASIAHEVSHALGARDMYDSAGNKGLDTGLMTATLQYINLPGYTSLGLDAWHRMQFGWVEPRIASLTAGGSALLPAAQMTDPAAPLLLYDPAHGTADFLLLEYRSSFVTGRSSTYDQVIWPTNGLAIWRIKQDGSHAPVDLDPNPQRWDWALWNLTYPSLGVSGVGLWGSGTTTPSIHWVDGTDTGIQFAVHPFVQGAPSLRVEWLNSTGYWVDFNYHGSPQDGQFATPFETLAQGLAAVGWGGTLTFKTGTSRETAHLNKRVALRAYNGPVTIGR